VVDAKKGGLKGFANKNTGGKKGCDGLKRENEGGGCKRGVVGGRYIAWWEREMNNCRRGTGLR